MHSSQKSFTSSSPKFLQTISCGKPNKVYYQLIQVSVMDVNAPLLLVMEPLLIPFEFFWTKKEEWQKPFPEKLINFKSKKSVLVMDVEMLMLNVSLVSWSNLEETPVSNFVESEKQVPQFIPARKLDAKIYRIPSQEKEVQLH